MPSAAARRAAAAVPPRRSATSAYGSPAMWCRATAWRCLSGRARQPAHILPRAPPPEAGRDVRAARDWTGRRDLGAQRVDRLTVGDRDQPGLTLASAGGRGRRAGRRGTSPTRRRRHRPGPAGRGRPAGRSAHARSRCLEGLLVLIRLVDDGRGQDVRCSVGFSGDPLPRVRGRPAVGDPAATGAGRRSSGGSGTDRTGS